MVGASPTVVAAASLSRVVLFLPAWTYPCPGLRPFSVRSTKSSSCPRDAQVHFLSGGSFHVLYIFIGYSQCCPADSLSIHWSISFACPHSCSVHAPHCGSRS